MDASGRLPAIRASRDGTDAFDHYRDELRLNSKVAATQWHRLRKKGIEHRDGLHSTRGGSIHGSTWSLPVLARMALPWFWGSVGVGLSGTQGFIVLIRTCVFCLHSLIGPR